jgi:Flp pilus assembly protein TadG
VEFAIALPLLAIVVFGTIDLGRAYLTWVRVKNAAREGAAYAQFFPGRVAPTGGGCADPDNITYRARAEGDDTGIAVTVTGPSGPITGCTSTGPVNPGQPVTVTASKNFGLITPLVQAIVGSSVNVRASVTATVQG